MQSLKRRSLWMISIHALREEGDQTLDSNH